MKSSRNAIGVILGILTLVLIAGLAACGSTSFELIPPIGGTVTPGLTPSPELEPDPDLSPEEVVRIQVEALGNNDANDTGIEITFRFASPSNKRITGPLFRFSELVKNPMYRPMLNHKMAEFGPLERSGDTATQRVMIIDQNGSATVFLFSLSRQKEPPCRGCWLTDSVTVVPTRKLDLQGI